MGFMKNGPNDFDQELRARKALPGARWTVPREAGIEAAHRYHDERENPSRLRRFWRSHRFVTGASY